MRRLLLILVVALGLAGAWFTLALGPADPGSSKQVLFRVESGESVGEIASKLQTQRLIRSPLAFRVFAKATGVASKLKAGAFVLRPSQSASDILGVLFLGKSEEISITIPEGYTVADIDRLLASKGLGQTGAILDCARRCDFSSFDFLPSVKGPALSEPRGAGRLEGYLFPETYYVSVAEYQPKFFLERMLGTFRKRIADPYGKEIAESKRELRDLVIMSSLVEAESRHEEERSVVAGILWKRLDSKVLLGVDATIRYALGKRTEPLTRTDLDLDSPYNTRKNRGLPPSAIGNAGESAFLAALRPKATKYWYYLHDEKGIVHYAVTNEEHNKNRALYLR
ncbi:MAG: endolytic transglycosylase MltG [Candidatus Peribacteraceae bacterium]